jgi:endonuclease/exonuclease/phosphatase (EEP) superfamily protein YafD
VREDALRGGRLIRIVSANLASGRADAGSFARLAHGLEADVVAVQELDSPQVEALSSLFPFGRLEVRPHRMGIALSQPGDVQRIALADRGAYVARVVDGDSEECITVVNAHILAPHMGPPWKVAAVRHRQVRDLELYLHSTPRPLVLVGDLNSTPLWPAYRRLARTLTDAAVEAARREGHCPRRTWGLPFGPRLFRIDHVLVAGAFVETVRVLPVRGSDHHAVVVDLRWSG